MPDTDADVLLAALPVGRPFAAVAVVAGVQTRDHTLSRFINPGAIRTDQVPFPLLVNHDHERIVGRVDRFYPLSQAPQEVLTRAFLESPDILSMDDSQVYVAEGYLAGSSRGQEFTELVESRMLRGVSTGAGQASFDEVAAQETGAFNFTDYQVVELSLASVQAIGPAVIWLSDTPYNPNPEATSQREESYIVASLDAHTRANDNGFPLRPPKKFFTVEGLPAEIPNHLTVSDDGHVYGYLAKFSQPHAGFADTYVTVPIEDDHAAFHIKAIRTEEGDRIKCGVLTMRTDHAAKAATPDQVYQHYDNTGYAVADVVILNVGDGYVVSGAMRTTATPEDVRALEGSNVSGDWRKDQRVRRLRLRAVLAVNVPGFPPVHYYVNNEDKVTQFSQNTTDLLVACFTNDRPDPVAELQRELQDLKRQLLVNEIDAAIQA